MPDQRGSTPPGDNAGRPDDKPGGAAAKTGPPSDDLDQFPTLEENAQPKPAADGPEVTGEFPTRMEIERTQPLQPPTPEFADPTRPPDVSGGVTSNAPTTGPPTRDMPDQPGNAAGTVPGGTGVFTDAVRVSPHVKALIQAGLLNAAGKSAASRGAFAVVEGRYELRDTLGEGGMGLVFLAYDSLGDCLVAVKTLKPNFLDSPKARARFIEEAKEMNRIPAHACVLVVKDFGSIDKPFYVTEYLTGGTVGQAIRADGPLPADLARKYAQNVARAIAFIHAKHGKLHRDVKPENVLIDDDGSARLADFGLIWHVGEGARGLRAGTVPYMPPEVVSDQRKNVGYEWDVYSFGATLYEMLVGHAPYADLLDRDVASTGKSRLDALRSIISDQPPTPILSINKRADRNLAKVADWAMARDARDRYFHVDHILADLEAIEHGRKPLGPQQKACDGKGRLCLLRRFAPAALVVLALAAGAVWWFVFRDATPQPATPGENPPVATAGPGGQTANPDPDVAPAVTDGPMFDQSRSVSPLKLEFDTAGRLREYQAAPASDWEKISFKRIEGKAPWTPGPENHYVFTTRVAADCHLLVLSRDGEGNTVQLFPNVDERDSLIRARRTRIIPSTAREGDVTSRYYFEVHGPSGIDQIKAIVAARKFHVEGVDDVDHESETYSVVPSDFRIVVDGQAYDSFETAFGPAGWQTVDLTVQIRE